MSRYPFFPSLPDSVVSRLIKTILRRQSNLFDTYFDFHTYFLFVKTVGIIIIIIIRNSR